MLAVQVCCARHCELSLSKMGNKGLFPGVAVPRAFFGTFFRFERKYCPPQGGSPTVRAVVGASAPRGRRYAPAGAPKGFPRGKQSARFALPCAPLVVCLNSGSLTAFGGCIHWIPASLRSPLETFGHRRLAGDQRDCNHCSRGKAFAFGSEQRDFFGTNHRHSRAAVRPACGLPAEANTHPSRRRLHPPR